MNLTVPKLDLSFLGYQERTEPKKSKSVSEVYSWDVRSIVEQELASLIPELKVQCFKENVDSLKRFIYHRLHVNNSVEYTFQEALTFREFKTKVAEWLLERLLYRDNSAIQILAKLESYEVFEAVKMYVNKHWADF